MKTTIFASLLSAFFGSLIAIVWYEARSDSFANEAKPRLLQVTPSEQASVNDSTLLAPNPGLVNQNRLGPQASELTPEEKINIGVYENTNQSVVNIRTISLVADEWRMFAIPSEGAGSGWVLDKDGHIVTNHHVIANSRQIEVTLHTGHSAAASLVGTDPNTDVAVLKIDAPREHLKPIVHFGDSSTLKVGQQIYAIGNPFGLERTLTVGIVSSLNRTLRSRNQRTMKSIIQIDAALNRGNSGGPLFDTSARLVGMNTAIATLTGENTGVGFAVPINTIRRVTAQLIEHGRVIRATIGITQVQKTQHGLKIINMNRGGPAQTAGLRAPRIVTERRREGDVVYRITRWDHDYADHILAVDGVKVESFEDLLAKIESKKPGTRVQLTILRKGRQIDVPVTLEIDRG